MTRWATLRHQGTTRLARRDDGEYVLYRRAGVHELFGSVPDRAEELCRIPAEIARYAPLTPSPARVVCVGLNYADHVEEMGRLRPTHPTLFTKFASTLTGAYDDIALPGISGHVDWEAELAVVIGAPLHRADVAEAEQAIAGYSVANDISMRDWQRRTTQWLPGKAFDRTTPLGPELVTPAEVDHARDLAVTCTVDGVLRQWGRTSALLFSPAEVIAYVSQFTCWQPGDVLLTGTPGGVGAATDEGLSPGQSVEVCIEAIGSCVNLTVPEPVVERAS